MSDNLNQGVKSTTFSGTVKDICSSVVGAYVLITLVVFPVFVTDMYFNILVDKYYFYLVSTISMAAILLILAGVFAFIDKKENGGENIRRFFEGLKLRNLKNSLRLPDYCVLVFFIVSGISTFCSEWFYEAFWGNMGRFSGFFLWIWYVVMYFTVTRFFKFKKWYLDAFIIAGLYVCIWGIQDYFQLDPHGFLADVEAADRDIFTSTIGNINTYTAVAAIYMAVASVLFITEGNALFSGFKDPAALYVKNEKAGYVSGGIRPSELSRAKVIISDIRIVFYLASMCVFFTAIIMGQSDNAVLSVAALLCFLPFLAWKNRDGFIRYLIVLLAFAGSMWFTGAMSVKYADIVLPPDNGSMLISLSYKPFWKEITIDLLKAVVLLMVILIAAIPGMRRLRKRRTPGTGTTAAKRGAAKENAAVGENTAAGGNAADKIDDAKSLAKAGLYFYSYRKEANAALPNLIRYIWLALGILAGAVIVWLFWDANHGGHPEWYAPYSNIMYFNIYWGTHRGHNWGILMGHFLEFPLWRKLIGAGPETYGIYTRVYDYYEMMNSFGETYDSAHNEYLQYLFTTGIIGLTAYLGWLITGTASIFRKVKRSPWAKACAFAVIAYGFQAFVNITVPIVVPTFLLMLSMGVAAAREESRREIR